MTVPTTGGFQIAIDGSPVPEDVSVLLVSAYVDTNLRVPDSFVLRFRDPDRTVVSKTGVTIGAKLTITVVTDSHPEPERLVAGEVTALEAEHEATGTFTILRGYDQAHRLFRGRHTESFTQATASDAATAVARRAGLAPGRIAPSPTVFDHISQCAETDWEFLDRLGRDIGFETTVRDDELNFGPPERASTAPDGKAKNPLVLRFGEDLVRLRSVLTAAGQVARVEARGWDVNTKRPIVGTADAGTLSAEIPGTTPADLAAAVGNPTFTGVAPAHRTQPEADSAAQALAERIGGTFAEVEGVARGNPKVRANACVSLQDLGAPFDGKFRLTTARHRYDPTTGYTTTFTASGRHDRGLLGLVGGDAVAGAGRGVVVAQVTDVNDPTNSGRVKLKFPWLSDDYVSDWARTLQPGAGLARGTMLLPEVGDEVLVAFEQDTTERPYVLGGLYNGVDTPPTEGIPVVDSGSGEINRRSFVSRLGHRIDLHDAKGRTEGISIGTAQRTCFLDLDAVGTTVTVHSDGTVTVAGAKGVTVDAGTSPLTLKGHTVSVQATNGVTVAGGTGAVSVDTKGRVDLRGAQVAMRANATLDVQAGGPCTVKGLPIKLN